ncbi:MAG: UvrD-helicase domain-containing protein [Myxococcales bacterium]|jgi:DNA helicase-2/ATP-dependent DNA helicase PcrA|nr:UvrD-helicase domain-containing protein [Myxococcales bacterium]
MLDLSTLNPPQREAVLTVEGPLLVLAGAGSGKTRVIVHRIAHMLEQGIAARAILAVTFTNKAAAEMRDRVAALVGTSRAQALTVSTFHAFGCELLRQTIDRLGYPKHFAIADAGDQLAIVKRLLREDKIDEKALDSRKVLARISRVKGEGRAIPIPRQGDVPAESADSKPLVAPRLRFSRPLRDRATELNRRSDVSALLSKEIDAEALLAERLLPRYQRALRAQGMVDFDDLILLPIELIEGHEDVRRKLSNRFRYLLVDEYQDTNKSQLELLTLLSGERRNVCAVGDDDQSIYSWRGAEVANILSFDRHFPGVREVRLEQNYRSTGTILDAANAVIAQNEARKAKRLWTAHERGEAIRLVTCPTERDEALFIASEIRARVDGGAEPRDIAILYRTNIQARSLEEALRELDLPYEIIGGQSFFDRKEIKDLVAYLKLCNNAADDVALLRILNTPPRGIGEATVERVSQAARQHTCTLSMAMAEAASIEGLPHGALPRLQGFLELIERHRQAFRRGEPLDAVTAQLVEEVGLRQAARQSVQSVQAGNNKVRAIDAFIESIAHYAQRGVEMDRAPTLGGLLHKLALEGHDEDVGLSPSAVHLMTLHAAKGLEWPCVFLCGMEDELMPHPGMNGEPQNLQEERRLAYVGITRARETLFLTRAEKRSHQGKVTDRTPSRFIEDIPEALCEQIEGMGTQNELDEIRSRSATFFGGLKERLQARGTRK